MHQSRVRVAVVVATVAGIVMSHSTILAQTAPQSAPPANSPPVQPRVTPAPPPLPTVSAPQAAPIKILPRNVLVPSTGAVQSVTRSPIVPRPVTVTPSVNPTTLTTGTPGIPNVLGPQVPGQPSKLPTPPPPAGPLPANVMAFDADSKTVEVKSGEIEAKFTFYFTNVSSSEVSINALRPSCGCTAAKLPETPWKIAPGGTGPLSATMNVAGSYGFKTKGLTVETSAGNKFLTLMAKLPDAPTVPVATATNNQPAMKRTEAERASNLQTALADRQAPLKGDCAKCHVEPTIGKTGKDLYVAACGICHNAEHKASMVTDLQQKYTNAMPAEFWNMFVTMGKPGTLMPAFAKEHGGFMDKPQIASLVDYLVKDFPKEGKIVYREPGMHAAQPAAPAPNPNSAPAAISPSGLVPASLQARPEPAGTFAVPDGGK